MKTKDIVLNLATNPGAVARAVRDGKVPVDLKIEGIPLIAEAVAADNVDLISALAERGANMNAYASRPAAERGMAPIHFAKSAAAVAALAGAGADINAPYKDVEHAWGMPGETALHSALLGKSAEHLVLAEALVKAGADKQIPYSRKEYEYSKDTTLAMSDRVVREGTTVTSRLESLQIKFGRAMSRPIEPQVPDVAAAVENAIKAAGRSVAGKVVAFGFDDEQETETFYVEIETPNGRQKHLANGPFVPSFENDKVDIGETIEVKLGADDRIASVVVDRSQNVEREPAPAKGPTEEQREALATFREKNGRTWKAKLNEAWSNGTYDKYGAKDISGLLQQVRNELGPNWLQRMPPAALDAPAAAEQTQAPEATKKPQAGKESEAEADEHDNAFRQAAPLAVPPAVPDAIKQAGQSADAGDKEKSADAQANVQATMPATLLNGRFVRDEAGIYRRQGEEREALADEGDKIRFIDKQMDAFQAGVELAKAKGWKAIEVTGSEKFRAEAWYHAKAEGLDVIGYEPTAQDLKRLERRTPDLTPAANAEQDAHTKAVLASRKDAQEFALKKDFGVQTVNTGSGRYSGRLLHETDHHVVQDIGRSTVAVHEKRAFAADHKFDLASKKSLSIGYADGKASLKTPEKNRGLSR